MLALTLSGGSEMKFLRFLLFLLCLEFRSIYSEPPVDWIDIPHADYKVILATEEVEIECLNQLISKYHSINKSSLKVQLSRIELLEAISNYLESLASQEKFLNQKNTILLLKKTVQSKRGYLKQMLEIPSDEAISSYHLDYPPLLGTDYEVISLRNNISYSLKMKEFWGKFWLESIDPCHRRLANFYQFWLDTNPVSISYQSFFLWLESQPVSKNVPIVEYYSNTQLKSCCIEIIEGHLRKSDTHELVNTDSTKRNLFIIDLSKDLYLEAYKEGVWHTSLSCGKPILGAGLLQIEQGIIKVIAFESGHYLPSGKQNFQVLQILREKGACIKDPLEVIYFEDRNKYKVFLSAHHLKEYLHFNEALHETSKRELISLNEF